MPVNPLTCLILEADPRLAAKLEGYINRVPYLRLLKDSHGAPEGSWEYQPADLVFFNRENIDTGLLRLREQTPPPLLICMDTARGAAADEPDLDIFGYLYRPYSFERFLNMVTHARNYLHDIQAAGAGPGKDFLFVKSEYKIIRIRFEDILFCEGMKDYTRVYLKDRVEPVLTLQNLKTFFNKLPARDFVRVHRSYIVRLAHIDVIVKNEINIGKRRIPIGENFRENFFRIIERH